MKSGELKKASITIAGKDFPLKLSKSELNKLRSIELEINNNIDQNQKQFQNMSLLDCITMVLISKSFELEALKDAPSDDIQSVLTTIESALDS